jgi:magnesium-transporting ATPase (P-type)
MSVIVQDLEDRKIMLLTKGADSVIESLLDTQKVENMQMLMWTKRHVQAYAEEGLRTLFMAKRELSEDEYAAWNRKWTEAATSIRNREARLEDVNAQIETSLTLIGCSAIEDKLQANVT